MAESAEQRSPSSRPAGSPDGTSAWPVGSSTSAESRRRSARSRRREKALGQGGPLGRRLHRRASPSPPTRAGSAAIEIAVSAGDLLRMQTSEPDRFVVPTGFDELGFGDPCFCAGACDVWLSVAPGLRCLEPRTSSGSEPRGQTSARGAGGSARTTGTSEPASTTGTVDGAETCRRRGRRRGDRARWEQREWIDVPVGCGRDPDSEVDVGRRPLALATRACRPDGIAFGHRGSLADRRRTEMRQRDRVALELDRHGLAGGRNDAHERHRPGSRSTDEFAVRSSRHRRHDAVRPRTHRGRASTGVAPGLPMATSRPSPRAPIPSDTSNADPRMSRRTVNLLVLFIDNVSNESICQVLRCQIRRQRVGERQRPGGTLSCRLRESRCRACCGQRR